ncbi:hypothetical protein CVT24_003159 [Panaeolus cyanescens]|uniref:Ubiquinone biosynthesis protein n=1 Tax=Panaeolus cyanescens TaxID=181874 RepID=A0A409VP30_9AGAR|nr:hypothetical protein CVT24_003159 [Panaeolus cyanescens]
MSTSRQAFAKLLRTAVTLVNAHGFTREALARSVLSLPSGEAHTTPLTDTAVSALFGKGDDARRTLIDAWMKEGLRHMARVPGVVQPLDNTTPTNTSGKATIRDVLRSRLEYNEPALQYLPEAFALLASPSSGLPPLDPRPALKHAFKIADEACYVTGDEALQLDWYARRGSFAVVYATAELHQLTSPNTAPAFLDSLLETNAKIKSSLAEVELFSSYIYKSCKGIAKSSGVF